MRALAALAILVAGGASAQAPDVSVTLSPAMQDVVQGETPRFEMSVRAAGHIRIGHRPDLRERLVKARVSGPGDSDDIPIDLSEMPPVDDGAYVVLEAGNTMRFEYRGLPFKLGVLGPGTYTLYVRYRADFPSVIVESNRVKFRVVPAVAKPR
jgi:hypothetical protein